MTAQPAPHAQPARVRLLVADVRAGLALLDAESVQTCVTSVPYCGLRSYGTAPQVWGGEPEHAHDWRPVRPWARRPGGGNYAKSTLSESGKRRRELVEYKQGDSGSCDCGAWLGELGNEPTPELYVEHILEVFRHVWRVLRKDATLWLNIGFSYAGSGKGPQGTTGLGNADERQGFVGTSQPSKTNSGIPNYKPKDLIPIPWLVAIALQQAGWYWRSTIAWCKKATMPESVNDRPTSAWEPILLMSKNRRYFYDADAPSVAHPNGSNMRNTWLLGPEPYRGAHFATFPTEVPRRCILAGSRPGDVVLDPFAGAGTTLMVAARLGRDSVGIELKPEYAAMAADRIRADGGFTVDVSVEGASAMAPELVVDKQGALGKRTYSGFNARWDAKEAGS